MTPRLPSLFTTADFSEAELCALVLDGTLYRVGDCFCVIDEHPSAALRARSLALVLPDRLIAERHTAAWVWGALPDPPASHHVCVDIRSRVRPPGSRRLIVREVVISDAETVEFAGIRVTTPLRTAIDLARSVGDFVDADITVVAWLMRIGQLTVDGCAAAMDTRRNLPNKKLALTRLENSASRAEQLPVAEEPLAADPLAVPPLERYGATALTGYDARN
ncbi:transcriptional regulator with AbiEi antitoxin domain of type IV toxin-antitoxin system [Glaciihabitans tibetensis]|uniref:Transcriptional regulator with AbiEi antitoxin domain of type IV toxin-antitoxin system n=1 Tax=Glaciihabitans tibetensis TaxID=1266600 RepID=A0A2T0VJG8_9MICO|nr:type IV toxin-antitoxin system AbiEi family antitoxin [Glaciihabitans tibetensis]PRY70357.1 transcriptional regulator with AbiEi antitoxin domain of type IV toxin-antitoxin system [Glaciihabitans tibetensis]